MKILVGDDDRVNQLVLQGMLKKLGYECTVVGMGKDVVAHVSREPVDLIFLDVQMPDINGFDVVREIRKLPGISEASPKIAFVSGHDACDFRQELDELEVTLFLTKPVTVDGVRKIVES